MGFIENKFTALEPIIQRREKEWTAPSAPIRTETSYQGAVNSGPGYQGNMARRVHQAAPATASKCPLCNQGHDLFKCRRFMSLSPEGRLRAVLQNKICQNCLYKHYGSQCLSNRRYRDCNGEHNTLLHNACNRPSWPPTHSAAASGSRTMSNPHHVSYVASDNEEVLLTTISLRVQAVGVRGICNSTSLVGSRITDITYIRECRAIVRVAATQLSRVDRWHRQWSEAEQGHGGTEMSVDTRRL
jgi:hypothetical protein